MAMEKTMSQTSDHKTTQIVETKSNAKALLKLLVMVDVCTIGTKTIFPIPSSFSPIFHCPPTSKSIRRCPSQPHRLQSLKVYHIHL